MSDAVPAAAVVVEQCAECDSPSQWSCANCLAPVCNFHANDYTKIQACTAHAYTVEKKRICGWCKQVYTFIDDEEAGVQKRMMPMLLISSFCCLCCIPLFLGAKNAKKWPERVQKQVEEFNIRTPPPTCIKVTRGVGTFFLYPKGHPELLRLQSGEDQPLLTQGTS
ncbi:hypothetical protein DIPPA_51593 [Diplonema papillatum]|nr:hypothetical protein DIPPA_51590 [Diplonema papillatum]KAJ9471824.1 hypothetical protein DIPPA_51592 [Diplonema papillatum]KAJ9471825.1 hypothetical protein DIPPA_51593 [Diplonema papillatum]